MLSWKCHGTLRTAVLCLLPCGAVLTQAGLRGHWTFDGTTADASGHGLDGVLYGDATYSTNVPAALGHGFSLALDGVDDSFRVDVTDESVSGAFTLAAWVRVSDTSVNSFFSSRNLGESSFDAKFKDGNLIHGDIGNGSGWITTSADVPFSYDLDTWYHIVYVATRGGFRIYVDGNPGTSRVYNANMPMLWDDTHDISIGKYFPNATEDFNGRIDDVAAWDQALTSGQVQQLAAGTSPAGITGVSFVNGSFEDSRFSAWPGYISSEPNGARGIFGWWTDNATKVGLNPTGVTNSPFANNGRIPDGVNVALVQSNAGTGYLRAGLANLVSGETYRVSYRYNCRAGYAAPALRVSVDTLPMSVLQDNVRFPAVGGGNEYYLGAYEFTAKAESCSLTLENTYTNSDCTVLVDDVRVEPAGSATGWTLHAWSGDADAGTGPGRAFTHAVNLAGSSADVNGVTFKAAVGANPGETAVAANYTTFGLPNEVTNDDSELTAAGGGSAALATGFRFYSGGYAPQGLSLKGLIPGLRYKMSIYFVGWHMDLVPHGRVAHFWVNGGPKVTLYHPERGNDKGSRHTWRGVADSTGSITVTNVPTGNASWHYYAFANEADPDGSVIIADGFAGLNGTDNGARCDTRPPDHANRSGALAYVETGVNDAFHVDIEAGAARVGANAGAAIPIVPSGAFFARPRVVRIRADVKLGSLAGTDHENGYGVGLGFYREGIGGHNLDAAYGFTGLVLAPNGDLCLFESGIYQGDTNRIVYGGTFDAGTFHTVEYDVDFMTGSVSNIVLGASGSDYSRIEAAASGFDRREAGLAGFFGKSEISGTHGQVDNFVVTELVAALPVTGMVLVVR